MNIIKIDNSELKIIQIESLNIEDIIEELTIDNSYIFHIMKNGELVGFVSRKDLPLINDLSCNKNYVFNLSYKPKTKDIIELFQENYSLTRLIIFVNGKFYGEYRNVDNPYLPKTIAKSIISLRYVPMFKKEIEEEFAKLKITNIGVLGGEKTIEYLAYNLHKLKFEKTNIDVDNYSRFDAVIDFKYGTFLRKAKGWNSDKFIDFLYFFARVVMQNAVDYFMNKKVNFFIVYDSVFEGMTCLSEEENLICDTKISFDELLKNDDYLKKFSVTDKDYFFVKNKEFSATSAFYSGLTIRQENISSENINIKDGIRYSGEFPDNYENTVHFFGPCSIMGLCGADDYTFEYQLQKKINSNNLPIRVYNHGVMLGKNEMNSLIECLNTEIREGDFVFLYFLDKELSFMYKNKVITLSEIFNSNKANEKTMFFDVPGHCNRDANAILANYFFNIVSNDKTRALDKERSSYFKDKNCNINLTDKLDVINPNIVAHHKRLLQIRNSLQKYKKIGSVTMYASPFTKGHEYLVEEGLKVVDAMVIFVVSDNFHTLYSLDRLEMVRENFKGRENVFVLPTDSYFASKQYFPEYSSKTDNGKLNDFVEFQEEVFANYVSSFLNIKYRFMGEEKSDPVTDRYNEIVKKISEKHGIKLKILPRFAIEGKEITGTACRKAIAEMDLQTMKLVLSKNTVKYIEENF